MDTNTFPANSETTQAEEPREVENVAEVSAEIRRIVDVILNCSIPMWSVERKFLDDGDIAEEILDEIVPPRRRGVQSHNSILRALAQGYLVGLLGEIKVWMADKPIAHVRVDIARRLMSDIGLLD